MKRTTDFTQFLLAISLAFAGTALTGCSTDESIDLNEIDSNIGIGSEGFTLPASSTSFIKMKDVLEVKDGDDIKIQKTASTVRALGDYYFTKNDDNIDATNPKVKEVTFSTPDVTNFTFPVSLLVPPKAYWTEESVSLPEGEITIFKFDQTEKTQITRLTSANATGSIRVTLYLSTLNSAFSKVDVEFGLPYFLKLKNPSQGTLVVDDEAKTQKVILAGLATSTQNIDLQVEGLRDFVTEKPTTPGNYIAVNSNGFSLQGNVQMKMTVHKDDVKVTTLTDLDGTNIVTSATVSNFVVNHAEGYFDPDIDPITADPLNITGIPDFLNDDKVALKLTNPQITLEIANNIDIKGLISGKLTAHYQDKDGKKLADKVMNITNIQMNPHPATSTTASTTTKIVICRDGSGVTADQIITKGANCDLDIQEILENIPSSIEFSFNAKADPEYKGAIDLYSETSNSTYGRNYKIKPKYDFTSELKFDAGSTIVYNDTIKDWNKDINDNDIDLLKGTKLEVNAKVMNRTPMKLYVEPVAIDKNKKEMKDVTVTVTTATKDTKGYYIPSTIGSDDNSTLKIVITAAEGALKNLDGLIFHVTAETEKAGYTLNSGEYYTLDDNGKDAAVGNKAQVIRIYDMKVSLDGQIVINVDKKK